ncbi:MAG: methionyl-tRNA formyltransferase [Trueperaceae bacterium]|nr:methionyl-tRNA formyltransferase [Trueperaceae bacterium]
MTSARPLRVALLGSPAFALPTLEMLFERHDLRLVIAQNDKPAGRRMRSTTPATALWAREHGVPLAQPERLKGNDAFVRELEALDLDVAVTAAYGKILPATVLAVPSHGVLNVHGSLLPAYRGAAPVQWALIDGLLETGVSIMQTETGLDTGPVRHVRRRAILPAHDARSLANELAHAGAHALAEALDALVRGTLPSLPQDAAAATHAPRLTKDDGRVRWHESARRIHDRYRGVAGWPGTWTTSAGVDLKVHDMTLAPELHSAEAPGTITSIDPAGVTVATGDGVVVVREVQTPGRTRVEAGAWAHGARIGKGERLG